jgi:hypothetical protein
VRAWPVAEANAIIAAAGAERILSKPRPPVSETSFSLLAGEARTAQQMWGDGEAEVRYDVRVSCDLCGKQLRAGSRWGECGKRPSAGGNIGGRRRADLAAQDFDLYGWRCACCGSGDVAVARPTAAEMPRRVACAAGFGTMASPLDSRSCACPATTARARRAVHARAY